MKIIQIILFTLLSALVQTAYATCTVNQKVTLSKLNLSAEEIISHCSNDKSKATVSTDKNGTEGVNININVNSNNDDANNVNSNNAKTTSNKNQASKEHPTRSLAPKERKFFLYTGLRSINTKPEKHTNNLSASLDFSIAYFPNSIKSRSFGVGVTLLDFQAGTLASNSNDTWASNTFSAQLFYVLNRGSIFSTIPFVSAGVGIYEVKKKKTSSSTKDKKCYFHYGLEDEYIYDSCKNTHTTVNVSTEKNKGTFSKFSAGLQLVSSRAYRSGRGFYANASYDVYSKIKIEDSSTKYEIPSAV